MRVEPRAARSQRCSRITTRAPQRVGTCVRAVRPLAPRITTASDTKLCSTRPDAPSQWLNAARTSCCALAKFCDASGRARDCGRTCEADGAADTTGPGGRADDAETDAGVDDESDGGIVGDETEVGSAEILRTVGETGAGLTRV